MNKFIFVLTILILIPKFAISQFHEKALGAWYMYFFNTTFKESSWGAQGDIQYRNWNLGGDLEQLLLRGGITFKPKNANIKFTAGYCDVTSGVFGSSKTTTRESRIYQEALIPNKVGKRFYFNHRFRYEQRFVQHQNFRTRYRYNLFLNVALTKTEMKKNTVYLALYNEIFINGQRNIGNGVDVAIFDRNRFYAAMGFMILDTLKIQLGLMNQTTDNLSKNQLQLSFHHDI